MSDTGMQSTYAPIETASDAPTRIASIIQPEVGKHVLAFGSDVLFKLTGEQTASTFTLGLAVVPPDTGPPPHLHSREDELFLILEGQYNVYLNGAWSLVGPGTAVYLPRGSVNTFRVSGTTPGKHWVIVTPSGFDKFFARCADVFAIPGPPNFARIVAINEEYGIEFAPPPPASAA